MLATKFSPTRIRTASISRSGRSRQRFVKNMNATKMLSPNIISIIQDSNFW
ncbi:20558_t:CDS:1, partial [Racocetra persica]